MRVVLGPDGPRLDRSPPPRPDCEHAVRVRVELAGLCRSDLKEIAGNRYGPGQFGHEVVAVVEESTLPGLPVGQRVGFDPNVRVERGTGFATQMWAAATADRLMMALPVIPDEVDARRLVFAEPLACAQHCVRAVARHLGDGLRGVRVAVFGAGTAGVLIAGLARAAGSDVVLGNRGADRTAFLRRCGVVDVPVGPVTSVGTASVDVAVVATSVIVPEVLAHALRAIVPGGLVLLYGGTTPGDRLTGLECDLDAVRRAETVATASWECKPVRVGGSHGTSPGDFDTAIRMLAQRADALPVERMITTEVALADLPAVLLAQVAGRPLGKTLVWPDAAAVS